MSNRRLTALAFVCAALGLLFLVANARAQSASCSPIPAIQTSITERGGGTLSALSHDQLQFARGLFVASPPPSPYPAGEDGQIAMLRDGGSVVVFLRGGLVCGSLIVQPSVTKLLVALDKSI